MVAVVENGSVTLYSRNGLVVSHNYMEVARALEGVEEGDAVIDGELVAIGKDGVSHFQLLQNALRHEAKLQYCAFDLLFQGRVDVRGFSLLDRKERLKSILPKRKLITFSRHRKTSGQNSSWKRSEKGLKASWRSARTVNICQAPGRTIGSRSKTSRRQEVVIAGFTAPRRTRPFSARLRSLREGKQWRYIGHVGTRLQS